MGCFSPMVAGLNRVKKRVSQFCFTLFKVMKYFYNVLPDIHGVINSTYRAFSAQTPFDFRPFIGVTTGSGAHLVGGDLPFRLRSR